VPPAVAPHNLTPPLAPTPPADTMDIVEMVLGGRVNKSLVQLVQMAGGEAIGLSGKDGGLLTARQVRAYLGVKGLRVWG
jgi:acetylglutamate kinase